MRELEPLADWFEKAITAYGQGSIRATARVAGLDERRLYSLINAERLPPLPLVRALAAGLEQDLGEVEQLWSEAKQRLEQAADQQRRERRPKLNSWAEIGHPEPALRDILEAQCSLLDCLPYRQLGLVEPLLSTVFVRQTVKHLPDLDLVGTRTDDSAGQPPTPRDEDQTTPGTQGPPRGGALEHEKDRNEEAPPVSLAEALNQHEHLLVVGHPGAGKSTLANQLGHTLAQLWLRESAVHEAPLTEAVVPLRLPATLLAAEEGPWSETVRNTVRRSLGRGLVSEPAASLFSGRVAGARWLLFVDGLDEIADVNQRADLIRTLAGHTRPGTEFRFVITTRPLSGNELAPLRASSVGCYEVQPFDSEQLAEYTRRWFDQQPRHVPDAERSSKQFLDDVKDGALQGLVKNPLLATIALVQATLRPTQPLPTSLVALYRSFIEILRRNRSTTTVGSITPSWAVEILDDLLAALAQGQVDDADDLLGDIEPLVRSALGDSPLPADWRTTITSALNQSGIVVIVGERIRFTHHSFAEFLAARELAKAITADEHFERWILLDEDSPRRSLARFTLWHWAEGPVGSAERLLDRILRLPGADTTLQAGSLIAEGLNPEPRQITEVCARLCGMMRMSDNFNTSKEAADLLAALAWRHPTAQLLEELVRNTALPASARYMALESLSRICPVELTSMLLNTLLEHLYGLLPDAATLSLELDEPTRQRVRERLADLVAEVDAEAWEWSVAAEAYRILGDLPEAVDLSRRVLELPGTSVANRRRSIKTWLALGDGAEQIASLATIARASDTSDYAGRLLFAQELADVGATDSSAELLLTLLNCDDARDQHEAAARLWVRLGGAKALSTVVELFERLKDLGADIWLLARLVGLLCETDPDFPGLEWCRMSLPEIGRWPIGAVDVLRTWASLSGPDCWDELSALATGTQRLSTYDLRDAAQLFLEAGRHEEARRLAGRALDTPTLSAEHLTGAAEVLLNCDRVNSVAHWAAQAREGRRSSLWAYSVLDALDEIDTPELKELSFMLAELILQAPQADPEHIQFAVYVRYLLGGTAAIPAVIELTCRHRHLTFDKQRELARYFAAFSDTFAARSVWRYLLSIRGWKSETAGTYVINDILQMDSEQTAVDLLQGLLAADPPAPPVQRARLERLLTWAAANPTRF